MNEEFKNADENMNEQNQNISQDKQAHEQSEQGQDSQASGQAESSQGYQHYTYGDYAHRIYRDQNSQNHASPNRYQMGYQGQSRPNHYAYQETSQAQPNLSVNNNPYGGAPTENPEEARIRRLIQEELKKAKPKHRFLKGLALMLVGAFLASSIGLLAGFFHFTNNSDADKLESIQETSVESQLDPNLPPKEFNISIKEDGTVENLVAQKAIPSIVGITTLMKGQRDPYSFFYEMPQYAEAVGSGVIIDSSGYILTNAHVVNNDKAENLTVSFANDDKAEAKLVWFDATLDLAIIKVDQTGLPAAELGNSDEVQVGDKAIAVGNPLGLDLQSTLTSGYISGLKRTIQVQGGNIMDGLIQTDAAINSGNSGGALLNVYGQVIGINTAKPQAASGIGFAIPINVAKPIIEQVKQHGQFESVYLGISGINVQMINAISDQELATKTGVYIRTVAANSPASKAGLKEEDILVAIDGNSVDSMNSLKTQLLHYQTGDKARLDIVRGAEQKTVEIIFEDFSFENIAGQAY